MGVFVLGLIVGLVLNRVPSLGYYQSPVKLSDLTGNFDPQPKPAIFQGKPISQPPALANLQTPTSVLGATSTNKRIEVDLSAQRLYAFEGDKKVMDFAISSGKWGRTPTGTFQIWTKLRYTKMSGGSKALHTYYYLPNVPYTMYFYNDQIPKSRGYGLHGAYWHNNFGHPMSHGCINMKPEEAGLLFNWADPPLPDGANMLNVSADNPAPSVIIYGTAPSA